MGLCFSYQQKEDLERISSLLSAQPSFQDEDLSRVTSEEGKPDEIKSSDLEPTMLQDCTEPKQPKPTYESKQVQVDFNELQENITNPPVSSPPPVPNTVTSNPPAAPTIETPPSRRRTPHRVEDKLCVDLSMKLPSDYLSDRFKMDVYIFKPFAENKKCLVLDIDYTIFDHKSDFDLAPEFRRPYLHEFLKACSDHYNIVIWSATAFYHVKTKMEKLQLFDNPDFQICLALCKDHMIPHTFSIKRKTYVQEIKPLLLLWMKFPGVCSFSNTIHIDDVPENFALNPKNGLRIDPFRDALMYRQHDRELFYLTQYLIMIAALPSFETLDHSKWKDYIINTLWDLQTVFALPTFAAPGPPSQSLIEHHHQSLLLKQALKDKERAERERERERAEKERVEREKERLEREKERMEQEMARMEHEREAERAEQARAERAHVEEARAREREWEWVQQIERERAEEARPRMRQARPESRGSGCRRMDGALIVEDGWRRDEGVRYKGPGTPKTREFIEGQQEAEMRVRERPNPIMRATSEPMRRKEAGPRREGWQERNREGQWRRENWPMAEPQHMKELKVQPVF